MAGDCPRNTFSLVLADVDGSRRINRWGCEVVDHFLLEVVV